VRRKWIIAVAVLVALSPLGLIISNNSGPTRSQTDFDRDLSRAMESSHDWILCKDPAEATEHRSRTRDLISNFALLLMVTDSARLSGDKDLQNIVDSAVRTYPNTSWMRMVAPKAPFIPPSPGEFRDALDYQRWFFWAMAPDQIQLAPNERSDLDSPDRMGRGRLTHQLLTWVLYRNLHGSTPELEARIRHLAERVAGEASLDFRITDMYLQRVAFILYAGHPDLIRARWVDRLLDGQQSDGGWTWAWFGWGPPFFQLRFPEELSSVHPTAQGLWITYMLKYRYPDWIKRNYR